MLLCCTPMSVICAEAGAFLVKQAARGGGARPKKKQKASPAAESPEVAEGSPTARQSPDASPGAGLLRSPSAVVEELLRQMIGSCASLLQRAHCYRGCCCMHGRCYVYRFQQNAACTQARVLDRAASATLQQVQKIKPLLPVLLQVIPAAATGLLGGCFEAAPAVGPWSSAHAAASCWLLGQALRFVQTLLACLSWHVFI